MDVGIRMNKKPLKITTTREYVEMIYSLHRQGTMNAAGAVIYERFLKEGKAFTEVGVKQSKKLKKSNGYKTRECYYNCQRISMHDPAFDYYEGHASRIIPVEHAWVVDGETGLVIDVTWDGIKKKGDYFGVKIPKKIFTKIWLKDGMARQVIWDYLLGEE